MRQKKLPLRKCVACQNMVPKKTLIRIVRDPEGNVKVDETGKASGRGAYICPTTDCFDLAQKRKAIERALKCKIDDDVYHQLRHQVETLG